MRSNSGLERFHRSSVSQRSLSATSFRADTGLTELLMPRGFDARRVASKSLGEPSWFGGDFWSMASLPSGKSATGLSAVGRLHSRYYWPMMKTAYTNWKADSECNSHNPDYVLAQA